MRTILCLIFGLAISQLTIAQSTTYREFGHFIEDGIELTLSGDGKVAKLSRDLIFEDPRSNRWTVPSGFTTDGASIPRVFWTLVGSPFTGRYRRAAVLHDFLCDEKYRPTTWDLAHQIFYEASRADGTSKLVAGAMYVAVTITVPKWGESLENSNIDISSDINIAVQPSDVILQRSNNISDQNSSVSEYEPSDEVRNNIGVSSEIDYIKNSLTVDDIKMVQNKIESEDLSFDDFKRIADELRAQKLKLYNSEIRKTNEGRWQKLRIQDEELQKAFPGKDLLELKRKGYEIP